MYYSIGNDLYKHYEYYTMFGNLQSNYSKDRLAKSWDPVNNPNGIYPLWTTTSTEGPEAGNESNSNYVQDGSYLRMQTLTLGYSLTAPTGSISKKSEQDVLPNARTTAIAKYIRTFFIMNSN